MKKSKKSLMLLPLLAICLSGCYTIIPEDTPEVNEDEFTPEGSYTLPEEDTSESSSIPYESTGGDSSSSPSETPGGDSSSDSGKPSEPSDPSDSSESGSSSSSTPSETHEYSYSLQITNKDNFTNIYIDEDNPENNTYIEDYSLQIDLYTFTDDVITGTKVATINDVSITSSDESVVALDGLTLIPLKKTGSATISVYWLDHSEAVDAFTCSVTYKAHEIVTSYEYELVINNKETLLNESWTTADSPREINVSVLKSTLKDGQLDSKDELENPNISLTQENLTEGETNEILLIDGLNVTPKNPGSVRLTASWIEGEAPAEDYFDIIVEEAYYEGDYTLEITDPETFGGTDDNPWYIGTSRELDVTLSYSDYAYSDDSFYDTYNKKASIDDVTISVYGVTDNEVVAKADDDLTWYSQNGEIMLSPVAANYDHYLVVVAWNLHPTATDYVYVHTEMPETTYAMTITNAEDIALEWKYDDSKTRTLKYEITQTTQGETTIVTDKDTYKDGILAWTYPSGYVSATDNEDGETITLELLKEPTDDVTVTVYVMWSEHTSAIGYVELDLYQYTYNISITNADYLSAAWSLEDNETRDVTYQVVRDNTQISELGTNYLELSTDSVDLVSLDNDNLSIKAIGVGTPTVTLTLYNEDRYPLATDSVLLNIDNVIKATSITLSTDSITLNAYYDTASLSATVLGANNEQATEQGVTWSVDNTGIVLTDVDDNEITVSVTGYNIEGTITCTSEKDPNVSATCSVVIGDQPNPDGPQAGDNTYKLGCKKSDGSYVFFDGTISSSHLQITEDWEQAADVYVTSNKYEMSENGCTLSFYDSNGTLQYLASSESSSSKGNMKLSTTPYRWVWDSYNGYSFFSAPAFEDRYIGLSSSNDFRTYAQSSLSSDAPVYPYSEKPEDYTYGTEEPEPETGDDDEDEEGLLGKFDFTKSDVSSGSAASASDIDSFWTGDTSIYSGCTNANTIYLGNNSSGGLTGSGFIRASSSSTNGELDFKFIVGVKIQKVVISAQAWSNDSSSISVNGSASQSVSSGSFSDLTFEISDDYVYKLNIDFTKRSFVQDIKIYGKYDPNGLTPVESLTINAEKTTINVNEEVEVSVTWEPSNAIVDTDNLIWSSTDPDVAIGESTASGTFIKGIGSGKTSISATTEDSSVTSNSIDITVADTLEKNETFVASELGYGNSEDVTQIDGHQVTITFAKGTNSSNSPKYFTSGTAIRVYGGNTVTFSAKYDEAPISSIVLTVDSSNSGGTLTLTNCTSSLSGATLTITPTGSGDPVISPGSQLRITQFIIYYTLQQ